MLDSAPDAAADTAPETGAAGTTPSRWSEPPESVEGRPLVLVLHGFGSDQDDVFAIVDRLGERPVFAAIGAPFVEPWSAPGRAWFPLGIASDGSVLGAGVGPEHDAARAAVDEGATTAAEGVLAIADALRARLRPSSVSLVGFSQGGIVAMQALRLAPERVAGAVLLSGMVAPAPLPGDEVLRETRPEVFWGRGALDPVIPAAAVEFTRTWLAEHTTAEEVVEPAIGHELTNEELALVAAYLARVTA